MFVEGIEGNCTFSDKKDQHKILCAACILNRYIMEFVSE